MKNEISFSIKKNSPNILSYQARQGIESTVKSQYVIQLLEILEKRNIFGTKARIDRSKLP